MNTHTVRSGETLGRLQFPFWLGIVAVVFAFCFSSVAQEVQDFETGIGFPSNGAFHGAQSGFDSVNIVNGNLHLEIPLWSVKGRGLSVAYKYVFDNQGWYLRTTCDRQGICHDDVVPSSNNHMSWAIVGPFGYGETSKSVNQSCGGVTFLTHTNRFLTEPDGTSHHMLPDPVWVPVQGGGTPTCWPAIGTDYADDGSGWIAYNTNAVPTKLISKSGTSIQPNIADSNCAGGVKTVVTDTNGNQLVQSSCTYPNNSDTAGRQYAQAGTSYHDSSGASHTIQVTMTNVAVYTFLCQFSGADTCSERNGTGSVPGVITLPNGMKYQITYYQANPNASPPVYGYGEPQSVILPTGGTISWTFTGPPDVRGRQVSSRTETANGRSYTWTYSGGIIDPAGNHTQVTLALYKPSYKDGYYAASPPAPYVTEMQYYQGTVSAANLRKTVQTAYTPSTTGAVIPVSETTTWNQQNLVSRVETSYDSFAIWSGNFTWQNPTEKREYSFGSSTWGPLTRKTDFTYLHLSNSTYRSLNISDRPLTKYIYDGSGNSIAKTNYTYDGSAINGVSGTPPGRNSSFGTTYTTRGNTTQISQWLKTTNTWLNTNNVYDITGNLDSATDPGGHTTSYGYADNWADGACTVGANTYVYLTSVTDALGHQIRHSYYTCTGLLHQTQGPNDLLNNRAGTTYTYDLMNRPLVTTFPDGGQITRSYGDTAPLSITKQVLVDTGLNIQRTAFFDGLNRILQTQSNDPDCGGGTGLVKVDYAYGFTSGAGEYSQVSTPYCNTPGAPFGLMTTTNHDALGRVTSVAESDGSQITTTYSGTATGLTSTVTDEAGNKRTSQTDAFGRMTAVWEDPTTLNYETDYAYDLLDNLIAVTQKGGAASGSWRTRTFTYDSLSRLKCAANPEVTSSSGTPASCPASDTGAYTTGTIGYTYDNDGNVLIKTAPAPNQTGTSTVVTTYTYDQVHRLTNKSYSDGITPAVKYAYDGNTLSGCGTNPPTLSQADLNPINARTSMCDGSGATSWAHDAMARVLADQEIINGNSAVNGGAQYSYYLDGELKTLSYPSGHVITYTANSAGRPSKAADNADGINYVTNAVYAPQGGLASLSYGGSVYGAFSYNSRLQPLQLYYGTNAPPALTGTACPSTIGNVMHRIYNFGAGTNDNGNVQAIANCRDANRTQSFVYDHLNRISQAYTSGSNWGEAFTIDAWGNLTNRGPISGRTNYEPLNVPATVKNQMVGFTYDSAGDLTNDGTNTYTYDAENRISSVAGVTYKYDGDGKRVEKSSGKLYWMGTGSDPLSESDLGGNFTADYIFFNGKRVARRDAAGGASSANFVQVNSATPSSAQTVSVAFPSNQTAGDMNIVVVGWNDTTSSVTSVTDSNGNGGGTPGGNATFIQKASNAACSGTTCSMTVAATGAGHILVASAGFPSNVNIASVSGGGTWVCPAAAVAADGTTIGSAMCYVLSSSSGATTITITASASPGGNWVAEFREYSVTGTPVFDTAGGIDDSTNCTSCSGVTLTLGGTNDLVVQMINPYGSASAVSSGWGDADFPSNYFGVADELATGSGAAPTWTTSNGHATGSALAFNLGSSSGGGYTLAVGPTTVGSGVLGGAITQSIYYVTNVKGGANTVTVTFNQSASYPDVRVLEYSGLSTSGPLDVVAAASGSSTSASSGSATTTSANELIFGANTVYTSTKSAGTGFASRIITHDGDIAEDENVTTTSSYSATATLNSSGNWVMQMAAFKAAGGAAAANVHYYFSDHLGSTSVITDSTGSTIQQESDYYPYGGEIAVTGGDTNIYKFTGKERDTETGLDNFGARYFGSNMGRFMSPDPVGGSLADPQSLNRYTYVLNNPLRYTDPTGLYTCKDSTQDHNCTSDQDKAFEAARQQDLKSKDADVVRAAQAYGDPNVDNHVAVGFADLDKKGEGGVTTSTLGADANGSLFAQSDVTINSNLSGTALAAAVGHEGSHVADAQDVVKSITFDKLGNFKVGQDITRYQSEQRAYKVTDSILRSANEKWNFNCGLSDCWLGTGLRAPAQLPGVVDTILANSPLYRANGKPLSPTNQGGNVANITVPK